MFIVAGDGAWSIGSVRASGTEGSEFEPSFRHPFLCGGQIEHWIHFARVPLNHFPLHFEVAAAIPTPSTIPPAATIGKSISFLIA